MTPSLLMVLTPAVAAVVGGLLLLARRGPAAEPVTLQTQPSHDPVVDEVRRLLRAWHESMPPDPTERLDRLLIMVGQLPTDQSGAATSQERTIDALLIALREAQDAALHRLLQAHRQVENDKRMQRNPQDLNRDWAYIDGLLGPRPEA